MMDDARADRTHVGASFRSPVGGAEGRLPMRNDHPSAEPARVGASFRSPVGGAAGEQRPVRKKNRLARDVYDGPGTFSVTVSTSDRRKHFTNAANVELCRYALTEAADSQRFIVLAYVFMPDHLHLLVEGTEASNLIQFMTAFKQLTEYRFRRAGGERLWQKGYYDHVLRKEEDVNVVAAYIFANPVRAAIVEVMGQYPFVGGALWQAAALGRATKGAPLRSVPPTFRRRGALKVARGRGGGGARRRPKLNR